LRSRSFESRESIDLQAHGLFVEYEVPTPRDATVYPDVYKKYVGLLEPQVIRNI
jgi:hypothetical protein